MQEFDFGNCVDCPRVQALVYRFDLSRQHLEQLQRFPQPEDEARLQTAYERYTNDGRPMLNPDGGFFQSAEEFVAYLLEDHRRSTASYAARIERMVSDFQTVVRACGGLAAHTIELPGAVLENMTTCSSPTKLDDIQR